MRTKHVIDVTPDKHLHPGAVVVMTDTVEDDPLEDLVTFSREHTEYVFSVDGREYSPAQFVRLLRRGIKLDQLEEYGKVHRPGWTFVVGGRPAP
jgi:hypothetical protein